MVKNGIIKDHSFEFGLDQKILVADKILSRSKDSRGFY